MAKFPETPCDRTPGARASPVCLTPGCRRADCRSDADGRVSRRLAGDGAGLDRFGFLYADFTIDACLDRSGAALTPVLDTQQAVLACYEKLRLQGALNDFQNRRVTFQSQHFADAVVMWMVVVMTLSGVGLAGYQIVAASKLSPEAMPESEFTLERGKLFFRSSVTGLAILVVSFAFFFTYIIYVYTIYDLGEDPPLTGAEAFVQSVVTGPELELEGGMIEEISPN